MRNILGTNLTITLFGESHGPFIGATLDGLCAGLKVEDDVIKEALAKRRPQSHIETSRVETDNYEIISGVFNGYTTGAPLTILIPNKNTKSLDYSQIKTMPRPSHADYVAYQKYHGFNDYRGGGHFSGRLTAPLVALGAIIKKALENKNIYIGTHIYECGQVTDRSFTGNALEIINLNQKNFPVLDDIEEDVYKVIEEKALNGDSIGGLVETQIVGLPVGLGEPWFSSVEGLLSLAIFGIGGIKGIEFGLGFDFKNASGSSANDEFYYENNVVKTKTNNNGGINGGITNGMPVVFKCVVKPTPSISKSQQTINLEEETNTEIIINGRHDPAIIRRICSVIDSVTALVVADMLAIKYGSDFLRGEK